MGKCVRCHSQEMSKWSLTKHARAWETLILRGEENNPECIACHSTGYGQPGGFGGYMKRKSENTNLCNANLVMVNAFLILKMKVCSLSRSMRMYVLHVTMKQILQNLNILRT